jgi:glycosyltransferase involved in cell wall biosynthesis
MRLFIIISTLGSGGAERIAATLANYWSEMGWDITLVTLAGSDDDFYKLDSSIERIRLNFSRSRGVLFGGLLDKLSRLYKFRRYITKAQPDIAIAFMPISNIFTGLVCVGTGITTIGSERNYPPLAPLKWYWKFLCRVIYPHLNAVTALTQESADWLNAHMSPKHIVAIPNPIDWPLPVKKPILDPVQTTAHFKGKRLLLAVGRLEDQKGHDLLMNAFAQLREHHGDWCLVILGEGGMRSKLERQRNELGLQDCVVLPGVAGNIGDWYRIADIYVMTSRYEGFGNTLAEGLAYGLPAVAVDCKSGPREILRDEIDGLLVPEDDPKALFTALDRLMSDKNLRKTFADRAIEVRDRFAPKRIINRWEMLFSLLMKKKC